MVSTRFGGISSPRFLFISSNLFLVPIRLFLLASTKALEEDQSMLRGEKANKGKYSFLSANGEAVLLKLW